ncbi:MAG: hypothetical protein JKY95_15785 [Planctomycetaceae bacterium]|nr:hypothetical protein [Planctomycetaceae bacterium]
MFGEVNPDLSNEDLLLAFRIESFAIAILIGSRSEALEVQESRIVDFLLREFDRLTYRLINLHTNLPGGSLRRSQVRDYLEKNSDNFYQSLCEWSARSFDDFLRDPKSPFRMSSDNLEKCFNESPGFRECFDGRKAE